MTSATWLGARMWRMRAAEVRALADDMTETEPKALMLRIADEYDRLAEWAPLLRARTGPGLGIIEPCLPSLAKAPPSGPGFTAVPQFPGEAIVTPARSQPLGAPW
jgi:hypothetical protein